MLLVLCVVSRLNTLSVHYVLAPMQEGSRSHWRMNGSYQMSQRSMPPEMTSLCNSYLSLDEPMHVYLLMLL